jgi:hypothetical protein
MDSAMLRPALLTCGVLALAGSSSDSYSFRQRGTVPQPRAALYDGQPMDQKVRVEGHLGGTLAEDFEQTDGTQLPSGASGAAVARKTAGGAVRFRAGERSDVGVELDRSWSPSSTTREGVRVGVADDAVHDIAFTARTSTKVSETSPWRLGFVANLGAHINPISRLDSSAGETRNDTTLLFRAAMVPSMRRGPVTLYSSFGIASESDIPADVYVAGSEDDPGAVADTSGAAFTLAAGATVDVGNGARLGARISDAFTSMENTHYGPQVDVSLSVDLGGQ